MDKLKFKIAQFMQGRNGPDDLYKGCLILYVILLVLNMIFSSIVIDILLSFVLVLVFFRFFSKNISARHRENAKYLTTKHKVKTFTSNFKKRFSDKEHVYRKCPNCKATLRFPRKKGSHDAVCPRCSNKMKVNVRF